MKALRFLPVVFCIATTCQAELPPNAYYELQEQCPNYLDIKVVSSKTEKHNAVLDKITYTVKVIKVFRSNPPLKMNSTIKIVDTLFRKNDGDTMILGPAPSVKLAVNKRLPAYLNLQKDGTYTPAKYGRSFQVDPRPATYNVEK